MILSVLVYALLICSAKSKPTSPDILKPSNEAAILADSRYLHTSGNFGTSYLQEDGVEFKEESDIKGNRKGWYRYLDPQGVKRTVSYTAGVDGFQASGDHLPVAPQVPAEFQSQPQPQVALQPPSQSLAGKQLTPFKSPVGYQLRINPSAKTFSFPEMLQIQYQTVLPQQQFQSDSSELSVQEPRVVNPTAIPAQDLTQVSQLYQQPTVVPVQDFTGVSPSEESARIYPPAKINLNQSPDGFSYNFNSV